MKKAIKEFREKFDEYRYKSVPKDMDVPMIEVENFILQKLAEQKEEIIKMIWEVENKKFPRGERKWCIECAKRIKREIITNLK